MKGCASEGKEYDKEEEEEEETDRQTIKREGYRARRQAGRFPGTGAAPGVGPLSQFNLKDAYLVFLSSYKVSFFMPSRMNPVFLYAPFELQGRGCAP